MNSENRRLRFIGCAIGIPALLLQSAVMYLSTADAESRVQAQVLPPAQCQDSRPGDSPATPAGSVRGGRL